ncbi:MAG: tail protein X [Lachnospiraceae bacterium]|nr:tail protein X [Lachnospiraceae bacterium]
MSDELKYYTTRSGDTYDILALAAYSEEKLASRIIEANKQYADILIFEAGIELKIPIIEENESTPGTLAPWR